MRTLLPLRAELIAEWHPIKNGSLTPADVSAGSHKRAWWYRKECGHDWEAMVNDRSNGNGCPKCSGQLVDSGVNDLATINPTIAAEWHPTKNGELSPADVTSRSSKKVWWIGKECRHEWPATIASRVDGNGCAVCRNYLIVPGINDLVTVNPELAVEWHPTKNGLLKSSQVAPKSRRKVWWLGASCGHDWPATINSRSQGSGCPKCSGRTAMAGETDLKTLYPNIAEEWHPFLNGELKPSQVTPGSAKRIVWQCSICKQTWTATVYDRVAGSGCSTCSNTKATAGVNDLATTHPAIAAEWHPIKNGETKPEQYTYGSGHMAHWLCSKGHTFKASINGRTYGGWGCPDCWRASYTSKAEKDIKIFLEGLKLDVISSDRKILRGRELDLYVPEQKVGIEFNGVYWHSDKVKADKNYHHTKYLLAQQAGIRLITIWEDDWKRNPEFVKSMLAHKLGVSTRDSVAARKTEAVVISKKQAEVFLEDNHIQGYAAGTYYIGLVKKENKKELLAVVVFKAEGDKVKPTLNIVRYATAVGVPGGFTKLLKYAEKTYAPEKFTTFSDNMVSDGGLYKNNGFVNTAILAPDYMYVVGGERKHKFGYRLAKFKADPNLKYVKGLSERELAELNGIARAWDAGKLKWERYA